MSVTAYGVDISPIISSIVRVAAIGLIAVSTWAIRRAAGWMGVRKNSEALLAFEDALEKSVHAGASYFQDMIQEKGYDHVDVKSSILRFAAPYLIARFAPILKSIHLDPNDPVGTQSYILAELDRKFPTAMASFANSPVTPTFPTIPAVPSAPDTTSKDLNEEEIEQLRTMLKKGNAP